MEKDAPGGDKGLHAPVKFRLIQLPGGFLQVELLPLQPGSGGKTPSWDRVPAILAAGPAACSTTRFFSPLKSAQPAWRANRETVASERPSRWDSCPMEAKRKASVLVLM